MDVPFRKAFYTVGIGCGLNNILPFRLGDFMHIDFARRFFDLEMSKTLSATLVERYFDSMMLLVLGTIILFNGQYGLEVDAAVYLFLGLLSCSLLTLLFYRFFVMKEGLLKSLASCSERARSLLTAIEAVVSKRNKFRVLFFIDRCFIEFVFSVLFFL